MTIETKFNIGDKVWFLSETKPNKGVIEYAQVFAHMFEGTLTAHATYTLAQKKGSVFCVTLAENKLFRTKQELLDSL